MYSNSYIYVLSFEKKWAKKIMFNSLVKITNEVSPKLISKILYRSSIISQEASVVWGIWLLVTVSMLQYYWLTSILSS